MSNKSKKVYIISGPAGVGKSTVSKKLVRKLNQSAYISGDYVSHMHINGREIPWESKWETSLIWTNILSLTQNFLDFNNDVVIDYVTFPTEVKWLKENLNSMDVSVYYAVLWSDKDTLLKRDQLRNSEDRMGERCSVLMNEFMRSGLDDRYILDTSEKTIEFIIEQILSNQNYRIS
ncbi:AAA family ATPase [Peribacillus sp. B-H-3]|uniref:AAA family ATPase n=1 Tax=Peribacillus sp. B-H-3 TaxID=3400420 RepID=UPI003B021D4F